jgi:hypothetical protein
MFIEVHKIGDSFNWPMLLNVTCISFIIPNDLPNKSGCHVEVLNREDSFDIEESFVEIEQMLRQANVFGE